MQILRTRFSVSIMICAFLFATNAVADDRMEFLLAMGSTDNDHPVVDEPFGDLPTTVVEEHYLEEDPEFTMTQEEIEDLNANGKKDTNSASIPEVSDFAQSNGDLFQDIPDAGYDVSALPEEETEVAEEVLAYRQEEARKQKEWDALNKNKNEPDLSKAVRVEKGAQFDRYYFKNGDEVLRFHKGVSEQNLVKALSPILGDK